MNGWQFLARAGRWVGRVFALPGPVPIPQREDQQKLDYTNRSAAPGVSDSKLGQKIWGTAPRGPNVRTVLGQNRKWPR